MLGEFDTLHFNSSIAKSVYNQHISVDDAKVVSITNSVIVDNRKLREYDSEVLSLVFIGNATEYKGFPLLERVLKELYNAGLVNWQLEVWGAEGCSECPLIHYRGRYQIGELSKVYSADSVLIVPSIWNETFSLITLEALSFGIPVLLSSRVGAKDIVEEYDPWFVYQSEMELRSKLRELLMSRDRIRQYNEKLVVSEWHHSIENHCNELENLYKNNIL